MEQRAPDELLLGEGCGHHRQLGELLLVREHDASERLPVEAAFPVDDTLAPASDDLVEERLTGLLELSRQHVGIDHVGSARRELGRNCGLAASDAARQADELHRATLTAAQARSKP